MAKLKVVGGSNERIWPEADEAEQCVLGGIMLENAAYEAVSDIIKAEDFYRANHRLIFEVLGALHGKQQPMDFVTMSSAVQTHPKWHAGIDLAYLGRLANDVPSAANVSVYARIVLQRAMQRRLMAAGMWIAELGQSPEGQDITALLDRATDRIHTLEARLEGLADQSWQKGLNKTESGSVKGNLANIVAILEHHPQWRDKLRLNVRSQMIVKCGTPIGEPSGPFGDADAVEIAAWLGRPDLMKMTAATTQVREAVMAVASRRPYNPLTEYLDSLQWDGEARIPTFFSDFCGSEQNEYTEKAAWCFFGGAIARAREPGSKVDLMLILEGHQGARKTSLLIALAGADYYAEAMESPAQKDFYQSLQGRWIIEIAEMQSFSKAEVAKVKQAITAQWDFFRPSYGHYAQNHPRQCVFVGTTNEDDYLRDATGARRFLPVRVSEINVEAVRDLRDQLWAEADVRFKNKEPYWLLPKSAEQEQDARYQEDSWTDPVVRWLDGRMPDSRYPQRPGDPEQSAYEIQETNTTQILTWAIGAETQKHGRQEQQRIGSIMRRLGWVRMQKRVKGRPHWVYRRPESAKPEADD